MSPTDHLRSSAVSPPFTSAPPDEVPTKTVSRLTLASVRSISSIVKNTRRHGSSISVAVRLAPTSPKLPQPPKSKPSPLLRIMRAEAVRATRGRRVGAAQPQRATEARAQGCRGVGRQKRPGAGAQAQRGCATCGSAPALCARAHPPRGWGWRGELACVCVYIDPLRKIFSKKHRPDTGA